MSQCKAVLGLGPSATFGCDVSHPHQGLAHHNEEAGAHWCSHDEAVAAAQSSRKPRPEPKPKGRRLADRIRKPITEEDWDLHFEAKRKEAAQ